MRVQGVSKMPAELVNALPASKRSVKPFADTLQSTMEASSQLRFSSHAQRRLNARNIQLTAQDVERLARSTDDAMTKGAKESLVLMDRLALVIGVPNRTVITVMEPHERANTVFTNIDSVVVVPKDAPSVLE